MNCFLLIVCFLFIGFYIWKPSLKENFTRKPNEKQFQYCEDTKGRPYYGIVSNILEGPPPRIGIFTQLKNNPIILDNYHKTPICPKPKDIPIQSYFNDNKIIDYKNNQWSGPINPFDPYTKPTDDHLIMYPNSHIESNFLNYHKRIRQPQMKSRIKHIIQ
jgi:hypothetical protein